MYLQSILVLVIHVLLKELLKYWWLRLMEALAHSEYWKLQMHEARQVTSSLFMQLTNFQQNTFFHNYSNIGRGSFPAAQRSDASEE